MRPMGPIGAHWGPLGPMGPMGPIGAHGAYGAHGAHGALGAYGYPWAPGPAATHPPGTETETTETTTDTATRAAPIANAPRDRIRRAGRFTPLTLIKFFATAIRKTYCPSLDLSRRYLKPTILPRVHFWDPGVVKNRFLAKFHAGLTYFHNFQTDF